MSFLNFRFSLYFIELKEINKIFYAKNNIVNKMNFKIQEVIVIYNSKIVCGS